MRWTRHIADKNLKKMNYFCSPFVVFYIIMNEMSKKKVVVLQPFGKHFVSLWRYFIIVVV